jgi:hypothetical protein
MSDTVIVALVSSSGTMAVAITALLLNYRGFNSIEHLIGVVEQDIKQLVGAVNDLDKRLIGCASRRMEGAPTAHRESVFSHDRFR